MNNHILPDPSENGTLTIVEQLDFEYVNPIEKIKEMFLISNISVNRSILSLKNIAGSEVDKILIDRALKEWQHKYDDYLTTEVPEALLQLLESVNKKDQKKLLKGVALDTKTLVSLIFKAYQKHGFTYSQYKAHYKPQGFEGRKLPKMVYKEANNDITRIGDTDLSYGELRHIVDHRKVIVSKFLDKGEIWHCFFLTYKSIYGEENYQGGVPHMHYISSGWGLSREHVVKELTSKHYKLRSLPHIPFIRHNQ